MLCKFHWKGSEATLRTEAHVFLIVVYCFPPNFPNGPFQVVLFLAQSQSFRYVGTLSLPTTPHNVLLTHNAVGHSSEQEKWREKGTTGPSSTAGLFHLTHSAPPQFWVRLASKENVYQERSWR